MSYYNQTPTKMPAAKVPYGASAAAAPIDMREVAKRGLYASDTKEGLMHAEKSRPPPGQAGAADHELILDSWVQSAKSNPAAGVFHWDMALQGESRDDAVGVKDKIENVVVARTAAFAIPNPPPVAYTTNAALDAGNMIGAGGLPVLTANGANPAAGNGPAPAAAFIGGELSQLPASAAVTMELVQLSSQAFHDFKGARHHFEFDAVPNIAGEGALAETAVDLHGLKLAPKKGTFVFTDPIQSVQGLTVILRNPDTPLSLPNSRYPGIRLFVSGVAPNQMLQIEAAGHGLALNNRIRLTNISTGNPTIDNYLNRPQGLNVGSTGLTADVFRLNPDVSVNAYGLADGAAIPLTAVGGNSATLLIYKNRVRIPLTLRGVVKRLTNYHELTATA